MPDDWIIHENIRRFREILKDERDDSLKRVLEKLLADELAKLPPRKNGAQGNRT
jgi:hypothetical protein